MRLLEVKRKVIVVYGGGFQPFHQGHMSSYEQAKSAFPNADFYVAASNDVKTRPIPFEAKKFLAEQAGVTDPFVQVVQPVNPKEILQKYNPEIDVLVLVRSERDPVSYTKKDGSPAYYQPWTNEKSAESFDKHGYVLVTKKHDFNAMGQTIYSGSQVRQLYGEADDTGRVELINDLYPHATNPEKIKQIFDQYLGSLKEAAPPGMENWIKDRKADFKKRYGDKWEEVLYATAWKRHNTQEAVEPHPAGYQKDILTMPQYTVVIDTPGDLDWYKIGQHFPNLNIEDPDEYGQGDSDMTVTLANQEEMNKFIQIMNKLGMKTKAIGGTNLQPEIHSE